MARGELNQGDFGSSPLLLTETYRRYLWPCVPLILFTILSFTLLVFLKCHMNRFLLKDLRRIFLWYSCLL